MIRAHVVFVCEVAFLGTLEQRDEGTQAPSQVTVVQHENGARDDEGPDRPELLGPAKRCAAIDRDEHECRVAGDHGDDREHRVPSAEVELGQMYHEEREEENPVVVGGRRRCDRCAERESEVGQHRSGSGQS
jgi:hypothetical protein